MQQNEEELVNRRGSLAISALLNKEDPLLSKTSPDQSPTVQQTNPSKNKRKRISPAQYNRLMEIFDQTDTPSSEIRENLAQELNMTKREVQVWFQNRRAKMNRTQNSSRQRQSSLILTPPAVSALHQKHFYYQQRQPTRRASAYPIMENQNSLPYPSYAPYTPYSPHPHIIRHHYSSTTPTPAAGFPNIAPMPNVVSFNSNSNGGASLLPPHHEKQDLHNQHYQKKPNKPSAIDLLASAAEYVRADAKRKE